MDVNNEKANRDALGVFVLFYADRGGILSRHLQASREEVFSVCAMLGKFSQELLARASAIKADVESLTFRLLISQLCLATFALAKGTMVRRHPPKLPILLTLASAAALY